MIWVWTVSLPVTILNSPNVLKYGHDHDDGKGNGGHLPDFGTGRDIAGIVLFIIGFILESVGDIQKYRFRSDRSNKGKFCDVGFFNWSRHPNYFGEIIMQFCEFSQTHHFFQIFFPFSFFQISYLYPFLFYITLHYTRSLFFFIRPLSEFKKEYSNKFEKPRLLNFKTKNSNLYDRYLRRRKR